MQRDEIAHDATVMREFRKSPAWAVLTKHLSTMRETDFRALLATEKNEAVHFHRGRVALFSDVLMLPDRIVGMLDQLNQAERPPHKGGAA